MGVWGAGEGAFSIYGIWGSPGAKRVSFSVLAHGIIFLQLPRSNESESNHGKFWLLGVLYITRYDTFLFILVFFLEKTTYTDKGEKVRKQIN